MSVNGPQYATETFRQFGVMYGFVYVTSSPIYKQSVDQISTPLAHVFNMSLQEGIVPLEWKESNIIPLLTKRFKKQVCTL